jgi:hypothetical protein
MCAPLTSSLEPAAVSSEISSSDTSPSLPSNGTPTHAPCYVSGSRDCASSKEMSEAWTSPENWLASMRSALDSLVRTSVPLERARDSAASDLDSTEKSCVQSTLFDLPGCSLRTPPASEPVADTSSSEILWRVDIPGATDPLPRLMSERHTSANGGGALRGVPTPTASDCYGSGSRNTATSKAHPGISLTDYVRGDGGRGRGGPPKKKNWPTPLASDWKSHSPAKKATNSRPLREEIGASDGGPLNPAWVEWLMGWPIGHTASRVWATGKCRSQLRRRGGS